METETGQRIQTDELRETLERVLAQRVKRLRRRRSNYSSSYTIENLDVELARGKKLRLVLKDLSPGSRLAAAEKIRPGFLRHPQREILVYKKKLSAARLGTPFSPGSVALAKMDRYWLFLERVDGLLLWQTGNLNHWDDAARWLATLHGTSSCKRGRLGAEHLLGYDKEFFEVWLARAEKFLARKPGVHSRETAKQFSRLAARYDRVVERIVSLPQTFIHGEFYPSNIIVRRGAKRGRQICAVDWEVAGIGPGLIDLAALTSGEWSDAEKRRFISAYREALAGQASLEELIESVEFCQLHLAVQLLGWAEDWTPPEQHSQNWLQTAFRLAKKLGVTA